MASREESSSRTEPLLSAQFGRHRGRRLTRAEYHDIHGNPLLPPSWRGPRKGASPAISLLDIAKGAGQKSGMLGS